MRKDSLPNLNTTHILFGNIAHNIAGFDYLTVCKGYCSTKRVNLGYGVALILLHFLRNIVQVIAHAENTGFSVNRFVVSDFKLDFCHRRLLT